MYSFNFGYRGLATLCVAVTCNITAYIVVTISRAKKAGRECSSDIKSATKFG
jgi:hypothetical protein